MQSNRMSWADMFWAKQIQNVLGKTNTKCFGLNKYKSQKSTKTEQLLACRAIVKLSHLSTRIVSQTAGHSGVKTRLQTKPW